MAYLWSEVSRMFEPGDSHMSVVEGGDGDSAAEPRLFPVIVSVPVAINAKSLTDIYLLSFGLFNASTPVFLITALDDYSEHLLLRLSQFHTTRCRKLKF